MGTEANAQDAVLFWLPRAPSYDAQQQHKSAIHVKSPTETWRLAARGPGAHASAIKTSNWRNVLWAVSSSSVTVR